MSENELVNKEILTSQEYFLTPPAERLIRKYLFARVFGIGTAIILLGSLGLFFVIGKAINEYKASTTAKITKDIKTETELEKAALRNEIDKLRNELETEIEISKNQFEKSIALLVDDVDKARFKAEAIEVQSIEISALQGSVQQRLSDSQRDLDEASAFLASVKNADKLVFQELAENENFQSSVVNQLKRSYEPKWTTMILLNGWKVHSDSFSHPRYLIDSDGIVHLSGLVKEGDIKNAISELPPGFRPDTSHVFSVVSWDKFARITVGAGGQIVPGKGAHAGGWISLSGISFKAAN